MLAVRVCVGFRLRGLRRVPAAAARAHFAEQPVELLFNVARELGGLGRNFVGGGGGTVRVRGRFCIRGCRRFGLRLRRLFRQLRLREQRLEQLHVRHDPLGLDAERARVMLEHDDEQVVIIPVALERLCDLRQRLLVERAQGVLAEPNVLEQLLARRVLGHGAVDIIRAAVEPVEHALCVKIAEAHIPAALFGVEVQDVAEVDRRADRRHVHIVRDAKALFDAEAEDAQRDDVLAAVLHERMDGHNVLHAAVGIILAAELFEPERRQIGAGKQHVAQLIAAQVGGAQLQLLMVGQGVGNNEKVRVGVADLVRIHDLCDPFAQRRYVKAAVADDLGHAAQGVFELREGNVAVHQAAHFLVVHVHDLGKVDVIPDILGLLQIVHDDHGAVERADGCAGYGGKTDAGLAQRLPCTDLVGALCAAALERQTIGLVTIQFQFHVDSPICRFARCAAAGRTRPRRREWRRARP